MNKAIIILMFGLFFLSNVNQNPNYRPKRTKKNHFERKLSSFSRSFKRQAVNKTQAKVIISMVFGFKRGLPKKLKRQFSTLNLLHLFTPSGLHFSALLLFLSPFFKLTNRWFHHSSNTLILVLCSMTILLNKFYSLKRIALLKIMTILFKKKVSLFNLYLLTFLIDFIFGSYQQSPLSFCYSFIFLGVLLSFEKINYRMVLSLFTGQLILAMFLNSQINLIGPFLGFIITSLFTIFFPMLLFLFSLFPIIGTGASEFLVNLFIYIIKVSYEFSKYFPSVDATFEMVILSLIILSSFSYRIKKTILVIGGFILY